MTASKSDFSERQLLILRLLADDKSVDEITSLVGIGRAEIDQEIEVLLKALDVHTPGQAVAKGIVRGVIGPYRSQP